LVRTKRTERPPLIRRTIESSPLPNGFLGRWAGAERARTGHASIRQVAPTGTPRTITRRSRREHERGDELFGMGGHDRTVAWSGDDALIADLTQDQPARFATRSYSGRYCWTTARARSTYSCFWPTGAT